MPEKLRKKLRDIIKQWGIGDVEAEIFAILATSDGLTAKEISDELGYAYSTTINSLNSLRRMGYVERTRRNRRFVYFANIDFVRIIDQEMKKLTISLKDIIKEIRQLEDKYKNKLKELANKIENAIKYLEAR